MGLVSALGAVFRGETRAGGGYTGKLPARSIVDGLWISGLVS